MPGSGSSRLTAAPAACPRSSDVGVATAPTARCATCSAQSFDDRGFYFDWLVVDVALHEPRVFDPPNLQACDPPGPPPWSRADRAADAGNSCAFPAETLETLDEEAAAWVFLEPWTPPDNATMVRHAGYRFRARWATRWHEGRIFVAGDAAHQTPPFAGQGMCAGLRDAANLAWKLDYALGHSGATASRHLRRRAHSPGRRRDRGRHRAREGDLHPRPGRGPQSGRADGTTRPAWWQHPGAADAGHRRRDC